MGGHSEEKKSKTKKHSSSEKKKHHSSKKNEEKHKHKKPHHKKSHNALSSGDRKILKQLQNANLLPSNHFQTGNKKNLSVADECSFCGRGSGCGGGSGCCRRRGIRRLDDGTSTLFKRWIAGSVYGYIQPTPAPVPALFTLTLLTIADCPGDFYELAPIAPNTIATVNAAFGIGTGVNEKEAKKGDTVAIGGLLAPNDVFNTLYEITGLPSTDSETYILKDLFPFSAGCKSLMANDFLQIKYGPSAGIYSIESLTETEPTSWVLSDTFILDVLLARPMVTCKPTSPVGVEYGVDFSSTRDCSSSSSSSSECWSSSSDSCESSWSSESCSTLSCSSSSSSSSCKSLSTLCSSSSSSCPFDSSFGESSSCSSNSGKHRRHHRSYSC